MADNVTLPLTGTGDATAAVATDDVGGSHYQRVKVDLGGDGVASPLVRGQQTATNSLPVVLASDQGAVPVSDNGGSLTIDGSVSITGTATVKELRSGTATVTSVGDSATSVSLLASNANRLGATIFNDSSATLYIKLGSTASTTSFTFKALQDDYYEVPYGYTGAIDGIWSSDAGGNARITELT